MSQAPIPTTTKSGTSKTALAAEIVENNEKQGITRAEKNEFLDKITQAIEAGVQPGNSMLEIEVPRKVIEHFNRGNMKDFDQTYYFIYHNVRVYEEGKKDISKRQDKMSIEDRNFGGYRR